jgi:hypothetical protein
MPRVRREVDAKLPESLGRAARGVKQTPARRHIRRSKSQTAPSAR